MNRPVTLDCLRCAAMLALALQGPVSQAQARAMPPAIDGFNHALADATRRMDNSAALALWEEDGISLLPSTAPIVGKAAMTRFFDQVTAQLAGAKMRLFEMECFDAEVSGDSASEWCEEHQVVESKEGATIFEGRGRMLLVLHRGVAGQWRLRREMWVPSEAPAKASR